VAGGVRRPHAPDGSPQCGFTEEAPKISEPQLPPLSNGSANTGTVAVAAVAAVVVAVTGKQRGFRTIDDYRAAAPFSTVWVNNRKSG
jgi:hypothetical protein